MTESHLAVARLLADRRQQGFEQIDATVLARVAVIVQPDGQRRVAVDAAA